MDKIKLEPLFDYYGQILVFKYNWMNYIYLEDAEKNEALYS